MWHKVFIICIAVFHQAQSFNIDVWVNKHCEENKIAHFLDIVQPNFYCELFNFTKEELEDIQTKNFIISNQTNIHMRGSYIGVFSKQFLEKFPLCEYFVNDGYQINLGNAKGIIHHPIKTLFIKDSKISNTNGTNIFQKLYKLKKVSLIYNTFDDNVLRRNLLGTNPHLKIIQMFGNNFEFISDDAFKGSPNIRSIEISYQNYNNISPHWFSEMKKLKIVRLRFNSLTEVPCNAIPDGVEALDLYLNRIENPNFKGCKFSKSLKNPNLGSNNIAHLSEDAFTGLENIENIDLTMNELKSFSNDIIKDLKNLKWVGFSDKIETENWRKDVEITFSTDWY